MKSERKESTSSKVVSRILRGLLALVLALFVIAVINV